MKKVISLFSVIAISSFLLLMSCNSNDNYTSTTPVTSEIVTTDTAQKIMTDTSTMMNMDTTVSTASAKTSVVKGKKGKVSSTMMASSSKASAMNKDEKGYYSSVEILPMFPGGQRALDSYINKNIEYPENATENGIEGLVNVYFAVDETGKVSNPKIMGKPLGYGLEDEVIKAVNKMPTWTPGIIKGKNVKTYYTLPVNFKIEQ